MKLAEECENEIVDGDIAVESEREANEEDEMVEQDGGDGTTVQPVTQHIPLVVRKVTAREAQRRITPTPRAPQQPGMLQHLTRPISHPLIHQYQHNGRGSDGGVKERDGGVDEERVARGETADEAIGDLKEDAAESDGGEFVATVEKDFEAERE